MATKLKHLNVKKVDFVDEGANPDAHITLFKRKDGAPGETPAQETGAKESIWKRLFAPLARLTDVTPDELDSAVETIEKSGAVGFREQMNARKMSKIADEMWDICFALQNSLASIMRDEELDQSAASTAMQESLDDFEAVVKDAITTWSSGKVANIAKNTDEVTEDDLEVMKSARDRLDAEIQKASVDPEKNQEAKKDEIPDEEKKKPKGDDEEMKIDKSRLTPAERMFLEQIEKNYGVEEPETPAAAPQAQAPAAPVEKSAAPKQEPQAAPEADTDDIYKGVNPAVRAELEALKKFREEAEDRELHEVAKRYTILGKKEEELFPVLKNLKAAGGTAYADMLAVLDQTKETVEKSGAFSEVGKSGGATNAGNSTGAWAEAETKAAEIMKSKAGITKAQALDQVLMADPALAKRCEEEE